MRRTFQNSSHKQTLSETLPALSRRTMLLGGVGSIALLVQACSGLPDPKGIQKYSESLDNADDRKSAIHAMSPQVGEPLRNHRSYQHQHAESLQ